MTETRILHLHTDDVSLVLDARGPGLPTVVHWGAPLGDVDSAELTLLAQALVRPPQTSVAAPVPVALLPEASAGHAGRPGLSGHRLGEDWTASFALAEVGVDDPHSVRLRAEDKTAGLRLTTELDLLPSGVLRLRHRLHNEADRPYVLDRLEAALPVPAQATELLDLVGHHLRERHPQRRSFALGSWVRENRRGRTGHDATIGMLAGTPGFGFRAGEVWALHVAWSGNHVTYAERIQEARGVLGGGELLLPGEVVLGPGKEYATPYLYAAYSGRGLDGISAAFHQWFRSRPHHPGPDRPRPVVLNTWEAVYFDHDLDRLRRLADVAARVGVERFVLDDGWFRHRRDDTAGLGDWYVDDSVWPQGLHPIVDHVRGLGMEFGLWFEPEMVNPDSDLFRAHPDWVLAPEGRMPPFERNQQVLDLANAEAYAYILERLDAILTEYDIAYVKWDHNRDLVDAGHAGHPGVHAQTEAVYRLLDEIRRRHPGVEIESCSGGGGRVDLGILQRTDRIWTSDCNDALERQTIQRWTGLFVPPELMGAHIGPPRAHTTSRTHDLSFRATTALFGHLGIEWDISSASDEELAGLSDAIAVYKRFRALVHGGELVRAEQPDPATEWHGVVAPDRSAALFCYTRLATSAYSVPDAVRLPGLDPQRRYRLRTVPVAGVPWRDESKVPQWCLNGEITLSGRTLADAGFQPPVLDPEHAWVVHVEAVS